MSLGRVGKVIGVLVRAGLVTAVLATAALPTVPASYVEESPSPSPTPTPTPTRTASPSPSPNPTASEPLPPADDEYWDDIDDPDYTPPPPSPSPSARASQPPRNRTDRVPTGPSGGGMEIEADERPREEQPAGAPAAQDGGGTGTGRSTGLYSQDAYPPGTFEGGFGLFTPEITDEPLTASPDGGEAPAIPPSGSRSTEPVIRHLKAVNASLEQVARTLAPFPVAGLATYTASWKPAAPAPGIAEGQGAAIVARDGTPVVAAANGPVTRISPDPAWGTSLELVGPDGTKYRYGRLLRVAPAIQDGMQVTRGQIIGFVGGTGTVPGGAYLWFQLADKDGAVVAPFEYLDRWLKEALVSARVTTGLPAVDNADQVAAGLMSPEEAGIKIGPDGRPVSDVRDMSALEAFLSTCLFAFLGWRGWLVLRRRFRKTAPEPQRLDLGFPVAPPSAALTEALSGAETAESSA